MPIDNEWQTKRKITPGQLTKLIDELGLDQAKTARFVGLSARTVRRMVVGEAEIPLSMAMLLRLMVAIKAQPIVPIWKRGQN